MFVFPTSADEISTYNSLLFGREDGYYTILSAAILVSMHGSEARLVQNDAHRPREPAINDGPSPTEAQAYKGSEWRQDSAHGPADELVPTHDPAN